MYRDLPMNLSTRTLLAEFTMPSKNFHYTWAAIRRSYRVPLLHASKKSLVLGMGQSTLYIETVPNVVPEEGRYASGGIFKDQ